MRSPDQALVKEECRKSIPSLLQRLALPPANEIEMDTTGWVNPCFFVDDRYVIRFNARDPRLPKFQREKRIYDLLKNSEVPVPGIAWLDDSRQLSRFDVLISQRIPGGPLEPDWPGLSPELRAKLAEQAGALLARLHTRGFDFFGEISGRGPLPRAHDWPSYLRAHLQYHFDDARDLGVFTAETEAGFMALLERHRPLLAECANAKLVHADYHFGNLLYADEKITGVLDFEWAFSGDPLYDLCRWTGDEADQWPGSQAPFLHGYGRSQFSEHEKLRIAIYQMVQNIEVTVVAKRHFDDAEFKSYLATTLKQFERLALR